MASVTIPGTDEWRAQQANAPVAPVVQPQQLNPSQQINQHNPNAEPHLPYVQAGDTGGYLGGVGVTIGQGRSTTPEQAQQHVTAAKNAGIDENWINDFLKNNPGDFGRLSEAYFSGNGGSENDPRIATSRPQSNVNYPGFQFNDPYTNLLEQLAKNQIDSLSAQNASTQKFMDFLTKQFETLSTSNGYSPEELAILNTQALEPIEQMRRQSMQRELERTGARGMLPTSGLHTQAERGIDTDYDRMRTAANRDLAVNNINERNRRLQQALALGQQAVTFPQAQNAQAINVANMLYQLPRQAMMDANTIVNGAAPQNALAPYIQLLQQQQQQNYLNQQQQAQWWAGLGSILPELFG